MKRKAAWDALSASAAAVMLAASVASADGEKVAVFGGDLSEGGKQELVQLFGADASTKTETINSQELAAALQGTGIEAAPTDKAISSSGITCLGKGEGLTVKTQNITKIPAATYANALVTAGVGDGSVLVAAPASNPVSGETALVGVLKAFPQCQAGQQPDPARVKLAYQQVAQTVAIAGPNGDLNKASTVMLKASQGVITGEAKDDAAIGAALDAAANGEGLPIDPARRGETVTFLKSLGGVDYGTYAKGYQIQQVNPNEAKVTPAGAGAPGGAGGAVAAQAAGGTFTGEVQNAGEPFTVRTDGRDRQVQTAPNVVITRDGNPATRADIRASDQVTVTTNPDGTAQRIDARSTGFNWANLLPLLLFIPLLGGLFLLLGRKKRRDDFIVERAAPVTTEKTVVTETRVVADRDGDARTRR